MNIANEVDTDVGLSNVGKMERYLKLHSSEETYSIVMNSWHRMLILLGVLLVIMLAYMFAVTWHVMTPVTRTVSPHGVVYTSTQGGRIANDELYYVDNVKYVVDVARFGYDIKEFGRGDTFTIYLNENQDVVDIAATSELPKDNRLFWILSVFLVPIGVLLLFVLWSRCSRGGLNPGRYWMAYSKWYNNGEISHEWFTLETNSEV